jgi:hypothetical protein
MRMGGEQAQRWQVDGGGASACANSEMAPLWSFRMRHVRAGWRRGTWQMRLQPRSDGGGGGSACVHTKERAPLKSKRVQAANEVVARICRWLGRKEGSTRSPLSPSLTT